MRENVETNLFGKAQVDTKEEPMQQRKRNLVVVAQVLGFRRNRILLVVLTVIIGTLYTILLPF
jgi:hypothetical protein